MFDVKSRPQPINDETVTLLPVLIHKINKTVHPPSHKWTGPLHVIVHVQVIPFNGFSPSFLSTILSMLGKSWLNRHALIYMRGTAIERIDDAYSVK